MFCNWGTRSTWYFRTRKSDGDNIQPVPRIPGIQLLGESIGRVEWRLLKRRMGKAKRAHHKLSDGHGHSPLPILLPSFQTDVICLSKCHSSVGWAFPACCCFIHLRELMGNAHQPRLSRWAVLAKELRSVSWNAQKHCPPYTKDLLISGLPQTLDAPQSSLL